MAEWHVPPDYIVNNWTEEQLNLYVEKLVERKERETSAVRSPAPVKQSESEELFFAKAKNLIKVVKK